MAKLTLMPDPRYNKVDSKPLVIRLSHKGKANYLKTSYILKIKDWDEKGKQIKSSYPNSVKANARVQKKVSLARDVLSEHFTILKQLSSDDIANLINARFEEQDKEKLPQIDTLPSSKSNKTTLKTYCEKVVARYEKANRFGMVNSFKEAVRVVLKFYGNDRLLLSDIDETFLEDLEADYIGSGNKINGLGVHLRAIRRIFNLAVKDKETELTANDYPFGRGGYSIKREKANKRAVKLDVINDIRKLNYQIGSPLWHHRNYFLFMFNMRGMNFIDLAFLTTDAIKDGRIRYKRRKTKRGNSVKEFNIKITEESQQIINHYSKRKVKTNLMFPILDDVINQEDERRIYAVYQSRMRNHNRRLNAIGKEIGLDTKLTTYVARHTFATAGLHKGVSKAQIGDMLGHTNYYTTEAYFADFDKEVLDDAADQILS
ncbi:site-specific integrase [Aquimarina sp. U1-2]|uniref:site-specific integrase n=1 Tax=Aquimarina sp. U1-2 TaxID=2823141 RepID=UPI001AEC737F|nr:site-specific integrase [Aquimarina sp. U1-2]MBP2831223.1 site-specific integrase [Aquimarina sp. U1-2]